MSPRPNILLIHTDQFNARCLSCAGHPDVKTPNLDRLARRGMRFTNAYAQNPVCTPSRISYLSGLYPSTHGYYGLYGRAPGESVTSMFAYFAEHGYRTGALGKLHTPRYWIERHCQYVYDEFITYPAYLEALGLYERNDNRPFAAVWGGESRKAAPSNIPLEHSCEALLAKQTERFLAEMIEPNDRFEQEAPWFAWVSFARPHSPIKPSEPYASMYDPEQISLPPSAQFEACTGKPEFRTLPQKGDLPSTEELRSTVSQYLGLVSQIDWGIGQILDLLDRRGERDNTIIVFTADHGDYAGEFGLWSKAGGIHHRAICRTPLFIVSPGDIPENKTCTAMVESIDVFPTLCTLAGLPSPNHVQGKDLSPLWTDTSSNVRDDALTENAYRKALSTQRWRYVANFEQETDELYDQENDPWEMHNRIDDPECAEIVENLRKRLFSRVVAARRPVVAYDGMKWRHRYDRDGRSDLSEEMLKPEYL